MPLSALPRTSFVKLGNELQVLRNTCVLNRGLPLEDNIFFVLNLIILDSFNPQTNYNEATLLARALASLAGTGI